MKKETTKTISLLTFNVNYGLKNHEDTIPNETIEKIIKAIKESTADIVFLQETHIGYEYVAKNYLIDTYPYQYFHHPEKKDYHTYKTQWKPSGLACLSKYKVEYKIIPPTVEGSYFPAMYVAYDDLEFMNVHTRPPMEMKGDPRQISTLKSYFYDAPYIQEMEIKALLKHFKGKNQILLGDFNADEPKWIKDIGFHDCLKKSSIGYTWYWYFGYGVSWWGLYDHIYVGKQFNCIVCKVFEEYLNVSDHLPVLAKIEY